MSEVPLGIAARVLRHVDSRRFVACMTENGVGEYSRVRAPAALQPVNWKPPVLSIQSPDLK